MMKNRHTFRKFRKNRGMALLCSLGVLSVILVIVMLFASKAKVESNVASIHLENQSARTLAKSLVPRIILTLNKSLSVQDQILYSSIHDHDNDTLVASYKADGLYSYDWIWKLEHPAYIKFTPTTGSANNKELGTFYYYQSEGKNKSPEFDETKPYVPTWQYILDIPSPEDEGQVNGNLPNGKRNVIARFAFVIIPRVAHLDPNAIANHVLCKKLSTRTAATTEHQNCNKCAEKLGNSPAELMFDTPNVKGDVKNTGDGGITDKLFPATFTKTEGSGWTTIQEFLVSCGIGPLALDASDDEVDTYINDKNDITRFLEIDNAGDREAYWSDDGDPDNDDEGAGDGIRDAREFYHRFNMRRTDWEKLTISDIKKAPKEWATLEAEEPSIDGSNNHDTGGIAWLRNWDDPGDWDNKEDTQNQVIANLLNYCSPATREVISDVDPDSWATSSDTPKYTGLKRTLYINECFYDLLIYSEVDTNSYTVGDKTYTEIKAKYNVGGEFMTELVDMYLNTLGDKNNLPTDLGQTLQKPDFSTYKPEVFGTVSFEYTNPRTNTTETKEFKIESDFKGKSMKRFEDLSDQDDTGYKPIPDNDREYGYYGYWAKDTKLIEFNDIDRTDGTYTVEGSVSAADVYKNMKVSNVKVKIDKILLYREQTADEKRTGTDARYKTFPSGKDKEYVDCAYLNWSKQQTGRAVVVGNVAGEQCFAVRGDLEAIDPRQNLRKDDWAYEREWKQYTRFSARDEEDIEKIHSMPIMRYKTQENNGIVVSTSTPIHGPNLILYLNSADGSKKPSNYSPKLAKDGNNKRDCEVADQPAWRMDNGKKVLPNREDSHISTAFIRHAYLRKDSSGHIVEYPMETLWELGAIHRGSRWQTINLSKSPSYSNAKDFVKKGAGSYDDGDAPILDQVKMINDSIAFGKVNLARHVDAEVRNLVIGSLFRDMPVHKYGFYPRQGLNEDGGEEDHNQFQNGGSTSEFKKMRTRIYDPENPGLTGGSATVDITTTEQWKSTSYVAALYDVLYGDFGNSNPLKKDENNSKFWRRTDFLSVDKKRSNAEANVDDILFPIRQNYGDFTDAQEEQIIGRTINLMKVDSTIKGANAILLVQTLKDSGNTTVYRDWNSDGRIESGTLSKEIRNHKLTQHQSGYRRFTDVKDSDVGFYDPPQHTHKEKIRGIKGSYQNGADGISGETKVIISLDFDTATQKWKMVKYEYAD